MQSSELPDNDIVNEIKNEKENVTNYWNRK